MCTKERRKIKPELSCSGAGLSVWGLAEIAAIACASVELALSTSNLHCQVQTWRAAGKRGIWLEVPLSRAALVGPAVSLGFAFHHAEPSYVMLTQWLPTHEPSTLPPNASHQVRK